VVVATLTLHRHCSWAVPDVVVVVGTLSSIPHLHHIHCSFSLPTSDQEDSRGGVSFVADAVYSPEELVAMMLGHTASLAEFHAKVPIKDAVIAVPPNLGQAERRGLLVAVQFAGINVLSLIN